AAPQIDQRLPRPTHLSKALGRDPKVRLGPPATLSRRLTQSRRHEALALQALERDVDAAQRDVTRAALLDRLCDRHPVRLLAQAHQREQHEQLETSEKLPGHLLNNTE